MKGQQEHLAPPLDIRRGGRRRRPGGPPPTCRTRRPLLALCARLVLAVSSTRCAPPTPAGAQDAGAVPGASDNPEAAALKREELQVARDLVDRFPDDEQTLVLMGRVLWHHGDAAAAAEVWTKALARNPRRADVHESLGLIALSEGDYERAARHYEQAIEVDPRDGARHRSLATAWMGLGRHEEAIAALQTAVSCEPPSSLSLFLLGQEYLQQKRYEAARECYDKAVALDPAFTNAYYGLATACSRLGEREPATSHLATFHRLKSEDMKVLKDRNDAFDDLAAMRRGVAATHRAAAQFYRDSGALDRARELLERATALDPGQGGHLIELGAVLQMQGRTEEALSAYTRARDLMPTNPTCHLGLGAQAAQLGRLAEAEAAFKKALELDPGCAAACHELARLYLRAMTNLAEARRLAERAVQLEPTGPNYFVLGWACGRTGDPDGARSAIHKAVELEPQNELYRRLYDQLGQAN